MQTSFKRHDKVALLIDPDPEYIEYSEEEDEKEEKTSITKGMTGEINILLPNGKYHVRIKDKKGNTIAYIQMDEENLEYL